MLPPTPPLISPENISGDRHSLSYSPSILIIAGLLAFAVVAIASIHLLLRYLSRSPGSPSPSPSPSPPFLHHLPPSSSSSSSSSFSSNNEDLTTKDVLIGSLPLFSFSAAATKPSPSSLDCAVCLSPFEPRDQLRLLPSCRHAFHSHCIDTWLRSTLSCPLCRSSVHPPPMPPPPPPPAGESSFRAEIGSVSRRAADENPPPPPPPPHVRTYSLGSSFEYLVEEEEEVEAVLSRIRRPEKSAAPPAGEAVVAGGGGSRNWLRDYVDRLVFSASSSFSSHRWSRRFDSVGSGGSGVFAHGGENWDLEQNLHLHLEEEDGGFSSFYRWLLGA